MTHRSALLFLSSVVTSACTAEHGSSHDDESSNSAEHAGTSTTPHQGHTPNTTSDGAYSTGHDGHETSDSGDTPGTASSDHGLMLPEVWDVEASEGPAELGIATDQDPAENVVEVAIEAKPAEVEIAPGRIVPLWTYNGQFPGPSIEAKVGDTVRVHFKNSLPEETTIHWHGVRVPAAMDGVGASQGAVASGEEFTYEFVVPDAGTFWYHPHVRSDEQVERGLYGAFIVRDTEEPSITSERTVVLDDILLDEQWQPQEFGESQAMLGRQGNVLLANGWAHPIVHVERGGMHRFRFINAANARYFRLAIPGYRLLQVGTDGGLLESPLDVEEVLLVPGERADILAIPTDDAADTTEWLSLGYDRGHGTAELPDANIFQMRQAGEAPAQPVSVPERFRAIEALPAASVERRLTLEESAGNNGGAHAGHGSPGSEGMPMFSINGEAFPNVTPLSAKLDAVEDWTVDNTTEMDHPFHLHGFRFQLLDIGGIATTTPAWRDTINIPAKTTATFRVRFEDHPGTWMYHCHILEHAERGMMGEVQVSSEL